MAKAETWEQLKYFHKGENWGDPHAIADDLLLVLDDFRRYVGASIHILHGVKETGHARKSYHYKVNGACAVDIVVPKYPGSPVDLLLTCLRFPFSGVGYYPHWQYNNEQVGGLHLDTRPSKQDPDGTTNYRYNRWLGVLRDGRQVYLAMNWKNIQKYVLKEGEIL